MFNLLNTQSCIFYFICDWPKFAAASPFAVKRRKLKVTVRNFDRKYMRW